MSHREMTSHRILRSIEKGLKVNLSRQQHLSHIYDSYNMSHVVHHIFRFCTVPAIESFDPKRESSNFIFGRVRTIQYKNQVRITSFVNSKGHTPSMREHGPAD